TGATNEVIRTRLLVGREEIRAASSNLPIIKNWAAPGPTARTPPTASPERPANRSERWGRHSCLPLTASAGSRACPIDKETRFLLGNGFLFCIPRFTC